MAFNLKCPVVFAAFFGCLSSGFRAEFVFILSSHGRSASHRASRDRSDDGTVVYGRTDRVWNFPMSHYTPFGYDLVAHAIERELTRTVF